MSDRIRSATGCWTCKIRKKKCPETKPTCSVCTSLMLECSGYGPRPEWMDGGLREKEMLLDIQKRVKQTNSKKKRVIMQQRRKLQEHERKSIEYRLDKPLSHSSPVAPKYPLQKVPGRTPDVSPLATESPAHLGTEVVTKFNQNESILVMHYLDNVFPCQFRFYQPSLEDGGRGWLLSILMHTKPLYYTACSLASYHRQMMSCVTGGNMNSSLTRESLQTQYDLAVTELRKYLQDLASCGRERTLMENVQLLSSMVLLVSTEAFISSTETWQMHLRAAITLLPDICRKLRQVTSADLALENFRAGLSFFTSTILWYDIFSSATSSASPFKFEGSEIEEYIHFDKAMGCKDWAMVAIKDIATLDHWKINMKAAGKLSVGELVSRGHEIEARLTNGLKSHLKLVEQAKATTPGLSEGLFKYDQNYVSYCVTRVYCCAALVYLHVTVSGAFPNLPEISASIAQAIESFKGLPDYGSVNSLIFSLIWPLCITGCMALEKDKEFFRKLSLCGSPANLTFGSTKARVIFEECWRLRDLVPNSGDVDWRTAMNSLGFNILLK